MPQMMSKVELLRQMYRELDIEVDGGVGPNTIHECAVCFINLYLNHMFIIDIELNRIQARI
jgi:ribulose-phosphate 3-epimerase